MAPLHQAFRDFDRYIEELDNIHKQFKNRSDKPISPSGENGKAKPARAENPQQQIADDVRRSIERGIAFSSARLFEIADKAYGGTMAQGAYTVKDAYDGMELAVNQYLMRSDLVRQGNGNAANAKETLAKLPNAFMEAPDADEAHGGNGELSAVFHAAEHRLPCRVDGKCGRKGHRARAERGHRRTCPLAESVGRDRVRQRAFAAPSRIPKSARA